MNLRSLCELLEQIAPLRLSAEWDNNGLLVGDASAEVRRMLLAIDLTDAVLAEAVESGADLVLCYHPPIFKPLARVLAGGSPADGSRVFESIRRGIALYAMHTTLDAAAGGTNDVLAEALGLADSRPLAPHVKFDGDAAGQARCKIVTFVPEDAVERVADALFAAGGGRIGEYVRCSFRVAGTGTFLGLDGTNPAVGQAGRFEKAAEIRLEIELPVARLAEAAAALRKAHPYETPAFDVLPLAEVDEGVGLGRIGRLASPATLEEVVARIKRALNVEAVWLAEPRVFSGPVEVAACCAGSCGQMYRRALAGGARVYLTGELGHHDALESARAGMAVVAVRHSVSERLVLGRLAERLGRLANGLDVRISQADADPFRWA